MSAQSGSPAGAGPQVVVLPDAAAVAADAVERLRAVIAAARGRSGRANIALTGGRVGADVSARLAQAHVGSGAACWWGDERWVGASSPERNDGPAAALAAAGFTVHRAPACESGLDLDTAARVWGDALRAELPEVGGVPAFDAVVLGVGEDGHVASLFPGRDDLLSAPGPVVAVRDSPKPPPERLSLSLPVLCAAEVVILATAGAGKRDAVDAMRRAWSVSHAEKGRGEPDLVVPAARVRGRAQTVLLTDAAAASCSDQA